MGGRAAGWSLGVNREMRNAQIFFSSVTDRTICKNKRTLNWKRVSWHWQEIIPIILNVTELWYDFIWVFRHLTNQQYYYLFFTQPLHPLSHLILILNSLVYKIWIILNILCFLLFFLYSLSLCRIKPIYILYMYIIIKQTKFEFCCP